MGEADWNIFWLSLYQKKTTYASYATLSVRSITRFWPSLLVSDPSVLLPAVSRLLAYKAHTYTRFPRRAGLTNAGQSSVLSAGYLCSSSIRFCRGLHNAATGTWRSAAAVLCGGMRVCNEEGVLPQDRGGFLELRAEWNEHHSKQDAAGGRVSTSGTLSSLLRSVTAGAHPITQQPECQRKEGLLRLTCRHIFSVLTFVLKVSDRPQKSPIFFIPPLSKSHVEAGDSWDVPNNSRSPGL